MAFHFSCRGSRFHAGKQDSSKEEQEPLGIMLEVWIGARGAPRKLYFDGEGSLNAENVSNILKRA